jgi:hypothetical protein
MFPSALPAPAAEPLQRCDNSQRITGFWDAAIRSLSAGTGCATSGFGS